MLRQNESPVDFDMTRRQDNASILTTSFAGVATPVTAIPLYRGDSASGNLNIGIELAEMPRPVENAIIARGQIWCVPRPAFPQFSGVDEYTHSYQGKDVSALGSANRTPASLFNTTAYTTTIRDSEFITALGVHAVVGDNINTDYVDAYNLVQNFRLAAHSSKMTRYNYASENADAWDLKPAFWPRSRFHEIVPDYEQALVTGSLELDVTAGQIPLATDYTGASPENVKAESEILTIGNQAGKEIWAEMTGLQIPTSLADIDKARTTNAFAKVRASYAGTNYSGFNNDDVVISDLMQGYHVPAEMFNRPWLLDSKTVVFGTQERHATDAANLDASSSTGFASFPLSINVPRQDFGAILIATVEIMPERLFERQGDPYMHVTAVDDLPNALRDLQRTEPVDICPNWRIDASHATPAGQYGFEPMNSKHKRTRTTLGGQFRQITPGTPNISARNAVWHPDYVNPALTSDHWLCPDPMPQDPFGTPSDPCAIVSVQQRVTITGITQFGDALVEDGGDFAAVTA